MKEKKPHSLRHSLLFMSILFVLLLSFALTAISFAIYRSDMLSQYQTYAGDTIDFLARCVDGDDLEACIQSGEKSEKYEKLQLLANDLKETHRLEFIYIIKPLRLEPPDNMMDVFAAWTAWGKEDGTDGLTDLGMLTGDAYPPEVAAQYMARMDHDPTVTYFHNDTGFGNIYTAIRPIFNSRGEPVAVLCGDILVDNINAAAARYATAAGAAALLACALVLLLHNSWYGRRIVEPIKRLKAASAAFVEKCRGSDDISLMTMDDPDIHTGDEIEELSRSVVSMVGDVRSYAESVLSKEKELRSLKASVDRLDALAYRDSMTGAWNKAAYVTVASRLDWDILAGNAAFALVMADLNYLKRVNDKYGHDKGDLYLRRMHEIVQAGFPNSPVFRVGGDEFVVVVQDDDLRHCQELLDSVKKVMHLTQVNKRLEPWEQISVSFGCAYYQADDENAEAVFRRADAAMYEEKKRMHAGRE